MGLPETEPPIPLRVGVLMVLIVPLLANAIGGLGVGQQLVYEVEGLAMRWDDRYDPVVFHDGVVTAGPRIVYEESGGQTILIDPDETIPVSALSTAEALVIRRTSIERIQPLRSQSYSVAEYMALLEVDTVTLDSAHIRDWLAVNRGGLVLTTIGSFVLLGVGDWVLLSAYAMVAARIAAARVAGRTLRTAFPTALALTAPIAIARWALWGVGLSPGCVGIFFWPVMLAVLTHRLLSRWEESLAPAD